VRSPAHFVHYLPPPIRLRSRNYRQLPRSSEAILAMQWHGGITCLCHCIARILPWVFFCPKLVRIRMHRASIKNPFPSRPRLPIPRPPRILTYHPSPLVPLPPTTFRTRAGGRAVTRGRTSRPDNANNKSGGSGPRRAIERVSFAPPARHPVHPPPSPDNTTPPPPAPRDRTSLLCAARTTQTRAATGGRAATRDRTSLHLAARMRRTRAATGGRAAMRDRTSLLRAAQTTVVSWRTRRAMEGRQWGGGGGDIGGSII